MKILSTDIQNLSKIDIVNNLIHLTIGGSLYTEKVNPANNTDPTWVGGKAKFTVVTAKGSIEVLSTASEWKATRTTAASFVEKSMQVLNTAKAILTKSCGGCSK
jgi:hypothetical protein